MVPDGQRFTFEYFSRAIDNTLNYLQSAGAVPPASSPTWPRASDPAARRAHALRPQGFTAKPLGASLVPDGRTLAMGGGLPRSTTMCWAPMGSHGTSRTRREGVWLMNPETRRARRRSVLSPSGLGSSGGSAVAGWSPDGNHVAVTASRSSLSSTAARARFASC